MMASYKTVNTHKKNSTPKVNQVLIIYELQIQL